jgi:hypothetical protein
MQIDEVDWTPGMLDRELFALTSTTTETGRLLVLEHKRTQVKAELQVGLEPLKDSVATMAALCVQLAKAFTDARLSEPGRHHFARQVRCFYANQLIEIISSHGRCFFFSKKHERVARLVYDGSVYLIDEKSGARVVLRNNGYWEGFGHNGTLRDLVTMMRDYVMKGTRIGLHFIGLERSSGKGNIWGYPDDQLAACRAAARQLPLIVDQESTRAA